MGQKTNPLCFRLGTTQSHHSVWFEEPKKYSASLQEDHKIRNFVHNYVQNSMKKCLVKEIKYRLNEIKNNEIRPRLDEITNKIKREQKKRLKRLQRLQRIFPLGFNGIVRIEIQKRRIPIGKTFTQIIIYSGCIPKYLVKKKKIFEKNFKEQEFYKKFERNLKKPQFIYIYPKLIPIEFKRQIRIEFKRIQTLRSEPNLLTKFIAFQLKERVEYRKTMKKAIQLAKKHKNIKGIKIQIAGRIGGKDIARKEHRRKGKLPLQRIDAKIDYSFYKLQTIYGVLGIKIWILRK